MILLTCVSSLLKQLLTPGTLYDLLGWAGASGWPPGPEGLKWIQRLFSEGKTEVILTQKGLRDGPKRGRCPLTKL